MVLAFGVRPGVGVRADTDMVFAFIKTIVDNIDMCKFTVELPACWDSINTKDANFEIIQSNTFHSLKLHYFHNIVTQTLGIVFVNALRLSEQKITKAHAARDLLKETLKFDEVRLYVNLSKCQIIEKFDLVKLDIE